LLDDEREEVLDGVGLLINRLFGAGACLYRCPLVYGRYTPPKPKTILLRCGENIRVNFDKFVDELKITKTCVYKQEILTARIELVESNFNTFSFINGLGAVKKLDMEDL